MIKCDNIFEELSRILGFLSGSDGKESACSVRDLGSIPGLGRSPGGGHGNPLQDLAWSIPWSELPGGLQSIELKTVRHDRSDLACMHATVHFSGTKYIHTFVQLSPSSIS